MQYERIVLLDRARSCIANLDMNLLQVYIIYVFCMHVYASLTLCYFNLARHSESR